LRRSIFAPGRLKQEISVNKKRKIQPDGMKTTSGTAELLLDAMDDSADDETYGLWAGIKAPLAS
jgi:hypothetical protein